MMQARQGHWQDDELAAELADVDAEGLRRTLRPLATTGGHATTPEGVALHNFSSNDYLGLASHPQVLAGAAAALERHGAGATASRLMSGHLSIHEQLEQALAAWTGQQAALVFGSGFLANLGVLTALAGPGDAIFSDKLNHASLIDGMRLSGAAWRRYRHGDAGHLAELIAAEPGTGRRLVVTDSVFSMDGDVAPLEEIARVAREHDAWLIVDEAHALGVFGAAGCGLARQLPEELAPAVVLGTMSKSLGSYGGFALCSATMREFLVNRARTFIYSTGLPPACVGAALSALRLIVKDGHMGEVLLQRAQALQRRLEAMEIPVLPFSSQILPIMVGGNSEASALAAALRQRGILASAVRPPTVPRGTARLRLSLTLTHTDDDINALVDALKAEAAGALWK